MQPNQTPPAHELPPEATQDTVAPPSDQSGSEPKKPTASHEPSNEIWAKDINQINKTSLIICALFIAFVDTPIVLSTPGLWSFYLLMLVALGVMVFFVVIDSIVSKRLRNTTRAAADVWMLFIVCIRNIILILNVIPLIQLLGMLAAIFAGPVIVLSQFVIVSRRLSRASPNSM